MCARQLGGERQARVQLGVERVDPREVRLDDVGRARLAGGDRPRQSGGVELPQLGHAYASSMIRGTLKRPSSVSGAVDNAFSWERHSPTTSSRKTFDSGSACDVGGTSSAATSLTLAA